MHANWIWNQATGDDPYNQYVRVRKVVNLPGLRSARLLIGADSWYRLFVNGVWVNDGPCRSWSHHAQYDQLDIAGYLREGENEIGVLARHFGCGVFQRDPIKGGLIAQLEAETLGGESIVVITDESWSVADCPVYLVNMPKVGLGMEPQEALDARAPEATYSPASVVAKANEGPWRNLMPRDVPLLTRKEVSFRKCISASVVERGWMGYTFSLVRLLYPGLKEGSDSTSMAAAAATVIVSPGEGKIRLDSYPSAEGPAIMLNGQLCQDELVTLRKGRNLLLLLFEPWGHHNKEQGVRLDTDVEIALENPTDPADRNAWDFVPFDDLRYHEQGDEARPPDSPNRDRIRERIDARYTEISKSVVDTASYRRILSAIRMADDGRWPVINPHWQFECRKVLGSAEGLVQHPDNALVDDESNAVVDVSPEGDIELCYDLGEQDCGYYHLSVSAAEGTVIDLFAVEYICPQNGLQHTWGNRNGFRLVCKEGENNHLSVKRRSGRYVYITIRNQTGPVAVRNLKLIESTYPVEQVGEFECSDPLLNKVWEASERTLRLCMEDVFTDCPLYEQTLWVGDARNEALFAMVAYRDVRDIIQRCIRLAAQSLETYPFIPSHAPTSSREAYLPAWCFLWGISIWDYYFYSGDVEFVKEIWPRVIQNLKGVEGCLDARGLFKGPFWNMFDWTDVDIAHEAVTHNSMLLKGSLDALAKCAKLVGDTESLRWMEKWAASLSKAVNDLWVDDKGSYVDSIHDTGGLSDGVCIHTNFLSVLYDIVPESRRDQAVKNFLTPPEGMVTLGSPFAMLYLYEALDKIGRQDEILQSIYSSYRSMLELGATTVWEQFPSGNAFNPEGFPTRSHCHAWSSSPILYLNMLVLGIRPVEPGAAAVVISPRIDQLDFARGTSATIKGPVRVSWEKKGNVVEIQSQAPDDVVTQFAWNETMSDYAVHWNGVIVSEPKSHSANPGASPPSGA